ncbi:RT0821/Lpp0805 family surface protein [Nitrobacter sp.]|uniref:RT0821/Lpp0805 family surface protein n=1 Tax=Nitrobacter sp. TaxID=29420 RepID=UPI003F649993
MSKTNTVLIVAAAALALGGCDVTSSGGPEGSGLFTGAFAVQTGGTGDAARDRAVMAATEAALGGLIGPKLDSALDDDDRRLAYQAQMDALERGAPGAPIAWRNPDSGRHGNIVAGPAYRVKSATCRGYSHTVTIGGQLETVRKTACRSGDGKWAAVG